MNAKEIISAIESGKYNDIFTTLYGAENIAAQQIR